MVIAIPKTIPNKISFGILVLNLEFFEGAVCKEMGCWYDQ